MLNTPNVVVLGFDELLGYMFQCFTITPPKHLRV